MCTRLRQGSMPVQHTASCYRSASPFIQPRIFEFSTSKLLKITLRYTTLHRRSSRVYIIIIYMMDLLCRWPPCVFRQDHVVGSTLDPKYKQVLELPEAKAVWPVTRSSQRMHKANQQDGSVYLSGLRGRSFPGGIYAVALLSKIRNVMPRVIGYHRY